MSFSMRTSPIDSVPSYELTDMKSISQGNVNRLISSAMNGTLPRSRPTMIGTVFSCS